MIAHIIANREIGMTECEVLLPTIPETNKDSEDYGKPVVIRKGEIAIWDDADTPPNTAHCQACWKAYIS